ncbi:MAG: hypothetical protein Q8M98_03625 [Candidatus Cloacimonadaceae bacterium]|nr:hypothetical protein [Candidatus Cloacimonadaceae bacterium]
MKRLLIPLMLLLGVGLVAQAADSLDFPMPQFINPFYDSFSRNYLSTMAMGRGNTGVAMQGGVESILHNPAAYKPDKVSLHLEMLIKPPVNTDSYGSEDRFTSPVPFGMLAIGGKLSSKLTAGMVYSLPKTIVYDDFDILMNLGAYFLQRYPTFNLHQITANAGYHFENLHLGVNLHNQLYYQSEVTILRSFESISNTRYILRPQAGILYKTDIGSLGLSYTPEQKIDWDLKFVQYDTVLPMNVGAGISLNKKNMRLTADLEYENFSAVSDRYNDRLAIKMGIENDVRKFTYRYGYMYMPEVYSGFFRLPMNNSATPDTAMWWDNVPLVGNIKANTQHFLSLGFTWHHQDGTINAAVLQEIAGRAPMTQINLSLSLYLSSFRRKGFLYFE